MLITTRIAGIPAQLQVHRAHWTRADYSTDHSTMDAEGGWDLDWTVLDRRGRPAPWLESKVDAATIESIIIGALA
jgi:hypothetical protein